MRRWIAFTIIFFTVVTALSVAPYGWATVALQAIGFLCSAFVLVSWTPVFVRARRDKKAPVSMLVVIDFLAVAVLGLFCTALRLWLTFRTGLAVQADPSMAKISLAVWFTVAFLTGVRAYAWSKTLLTHPRDALHKLVSDQIDPHH